jgi:hypothetical protein
VYEVPQPTLRQRKRLADEELLFRVKQYEHLLRQHNVEFDPQDEDWSPEATGKAVSHEDLQDMSPSIGGKER